MTKKIILSIIIVLILVVGGVFWWEKREIKGSPNDYVIKETSEGKIVENKRAGLKVKTPEGWETKRVEFEEGAIDFISPDLGADWKEGKIVLPLKKGCKIQNSVYYGKLDFASIKIESRYSYALMGMKSINFEEITINNYHALKSTFDREEGGAGVGMSISIPANNKIYGFSVVWASDDKEKCIQEFNKFLETILIR